MVNEDEFKKLLVTKLRSRTELVANSIVSSQLGNKVGFRKVSDDELGAKYEAVLV